MNRTRTIPWVADPLYPDCDGQPMSDSTLQWQCMVTIKEGLEAQYADDPDVFVAGDLLWYPVEGRSEVRAAPDALTAFGRPKGYRGSYMQWREGGVAPQVVFEVLSPGNTAAEMRRKFRFYERYGVEEYYVYDPGPNAWTGYQRGGGRLHEIPSMAGWVSPRLKVRFETEAGGLELYHPDGQRFLTFVELVKQQEQERQEKEEAQQHAAKEKKRGDKEKERADMEKERADMAIQQVDKEKERAGRLAAQLRAIGIDPEG